MGEKAINLIEENYTQYIPLDPIAFSMAEGDACQVIIVDKNSNVYCFRNCPKINKEESALTIIIV